MKEPAVAGDAKTIGTIGGMGPAATVELMSRIVRKTPVHDDQDHFRILVDNDPKVPSRVAAILKKTGEDSAPTLAGKAQARERHILAE
jgi:aspartate racemase